jgi:hypothetical protein
MPLREEVQSFVSGCEKVQEFLAGGGSLTEDQRGVVEMAALDLLAQIRPSNGPAPSRPFLL